MGTYPGGSIVRVEPTVIAGTTHDNDVMFDATEIPGAVSSRGGVSKLLGFTIIDKDNEAHDMDLVFMQKQTNFGTAGAAQDITDANLSAAKIICISKIDWSESQMNVVQDTGQASIISTFSLLGTAGSNVWQFHPCLVQAEGGSTSIYFTAVTREESALATTSDLEFIFHFEYLN